MKTIHEQIEEFARQAVEKLGLYLLDIEIKNTSSRQPIISVVADSEAGITIGECSALSRELGDMIDAYELLNANYRLDVTSPGMSIPMTHDWQLRRAVGKKIHVKLNDEERSEVEGEFASFDENHYHVITGKKKEITDINRGDVAEIKVIPQW